VRGSSWEEIRDRVLDAVVPGQAEVEAVEKFARKVVEDLGIRLAEVGISGITEVHGSVARGTWISGDRDFDVFIVLEEEYRRSDLQTVLDVVKDFVGEGWIEAYAEHPYLIAEIDGFTVDFVPCFHINPKNGLVSATDRTPLHTRFVLDHLAESAKDEVRLLKRFMKGIGVYGAEVKVGGFSGYLCELLMIAIGSFERVLETASGWRQGEVVDPLKNADHGNFKKRFREPLIVQDPVDPRRNVASAVSENRFWEFSAAARAFLEGPRWEFFYPVEREVNIDGLMTRVRSHGFDLVFLVVRDGEVEVQDVLWGQLYKSERALVTALGKTGFSVVRSKVWSDELSRHIFVFELESAILSSFVVKTGPPVRIVEGSRRFLETYTSSDDTVSGPWVKGDRWQVMVKRGNREVGTALKSLLKDGGRGIGISGGIAERVSRGFSILLGGGAESVVTPDFAVILDAFLRGRHGWFE
jgi:tRNA nucleotidyltransferase (CCA-adding enzyme)